MKLHHLKRYYLNAKHRATRENVPFSLVLQDLIDIATDVCPILHTPFVWGSAKLGKGKTRPDTPTLDRVLPELGYVRGNVVFLSYRANRIKDNGTMQEHYDIADFIWNHVHAKKITATPVSTRPNQQGDISKEHGTIPTAGIGEIGDSTHHHYGTVRGEDVNHRAQAGSGDGLGRRGKEVVALVALERIESNGEPDTETVRLEYRGRYLPD